MDSHRNKGRQYRPTRDEYASAKATIEAAGYSMDTAIRAFLRFLNEDPDRIALIAEHLAAVRRDTPPGRPSRLESMFQAENRRRSRSAADVSVQLAGKALAGSTGRTRRVLLARIDHPDETLAQLAERCGMTKYKYGSVLRRAIRKVGGAPVAKRTTPRSQADPRTIAANARDVPLARVALRGATGRARDVLALRVENPDETLAQLGARCGLTSSGYSSALRRALRD